MRPDQSAHIDEFVRVTSGTATRRDAVIQDSWRRCVAEHKLDPVALRDPHILPQELLREHRDAMDEFLPLRDFFEVDIDDLPPHPGNEKPSREGRRCRPLSGS